MAYHPAPDWGQQERLADLRTRLCSLTIDASAAAEVTHDPMGYLRGFVTTLDDALAYLAVAQENLASALTKEAV